MIPKVIHYCWFGGNEKPDIVKKCVASWKEYCPDYELIEWNEDNFDVDMIPFTKAAYENKKWAFVSDCARLWIVYHYGGIYLDTDVLLHSSLDELLQYSCWLASDDVRYVSTGLGFGAVKENDLIGKIMDAYKEYEYPSGTNVTRDTKVLENALPMWKKSNLSQVIDDIMIIGMRDYGSFAQHLYTYTWSDDKDAVADRERQLLADKKLSVKKRLAWKIKCKVRSPKLIGYFDARKGSKLEKIYTFLAYDFLDYGPWHFIKGVFNKIKNKFTK